MLNDDNPQSPGPEKPLTLHSTAAALSVPYYTSQSTGPEKLLTLHAAAAALGIPYYKIQRAGRAELFPTYRLLNSRPLVKLSEVMAAIEATQRGGAR